MLKPYFQNESTGVSKINMISLARMKSGGTYEQRFMK